MQHGGDVPVVLKLPSWWWSLGVGPLVLCLLPPLLVQGPQMDLALRFFWVGFGAFFLLYDAAMMMRLRIELDGAALTLRGMVMRRCIDLRELASADARLGRNGWFLKLRDRSGRKITINLYGYRKADRQQLLAGLEEYLYAPEVQHSRLLDRYFREVGGFDPVFLASTEPRAVFPESFT